MTEPTKPKQSSQDNESSDALILTPISIARARHASTHGPSVLSKTDKTSPSGKKKHSDGQRKSSSETSQTQSGLMPLFNGSNGCLLIALLGIAFIMGGILGGLIGGGLLLWAGDSGLIAGFQDTPTPAPTPSPTPLPADTPTPTATPEPVITPSTADIIEMVFPSVVTVINQQNKFINPLDEGRVVGTGVVIDARGYIATNNHVVDNPGDIKILLSDGRDLEAELVAANPAEDLALLKIETTGLQPVDWGHSSTIRPGQVVYAIGSPLGDFPNSVSFGIVSGLNRALEIDKFVIDGLIQTDAAINRGSSGGPLITPDGKVVGINTFIIRESDERGIAEGIAFAIPAETAKNLLIPWIAAHTGESIPIPASEGSR